MFEGEIRAANPWWSDPTAIDRDPAILNAERSHVQRIPGERHRFAAGDHVYTLRGARRVGKTTLLMMEIKRLLGKGVPPRDILYYSFETEGRPADIYMLVTEYLAMNGGSGRRFIFLDEVTGIRLWDKGVKKLLDRGSLRNCTLVMTGSHAADVAVSAAQLYGRREEPRAGTSDRILHPMGFGEYAAARDEAVRSRLRGLSLDDGQARIEDVRSMLGGELPGRVRELLPLVDILNAHFHNYMLSGGMPEVVNRLAVDGIVPDETYNAYLGRTYADMARSGLRREWASPILKSVARSVGSAASWQSLKAGTDIESPRVIEEYAHKMSDILLLLVLYRYNSSDDAPKRNTLKKIYFSDPFFHNAWASAGKPGPFARNEAALGDDLRAGSLIEQAVACHVVRLASDLNARNDPVGLFDTVFYWRSNRGREVDFVVRNGEGGAGAGGSVSPIEVKWQGRVRRDDLHGMFDFRKAAGMGGCGGLVLSRDVAEERSGMAVVPASVFALLA